MTNDPNFKHLREDVQPLEDAPEEPKVQVDHHVGETAIAALFLIVLAAVVTLSFILLMVVALHK